MFVSKVAHAHKKQLSGPRRCGLGCQAPCVHARFRSVNPRRRFVLDGKSVPLIEQPG